jgi:hypothetical protein
VEEMTKFYIYKNTTEFGGGFFATVAATDFLVENGAYVFYKSNVHYKVAAFSTREFYVMRNV